MSRGGPRKGAGRPAGTTQPDPDPKEPMTLRMERSLRQKARNIGDGNESEGIRRALRAFKI